MNKQFTEKTAAAVLNRLLKSCIKNQPKREAYHKAWIDAAGRQCVCDGYRAYRINTRLDAVETSAEQIPMDLDKIFQPLNAGKVEEMPAPDPEAVNLAIIDGKNHSRPALYDCGPEKPAFNAEYLREILRLFPGAKWYFNPAAPTTGPAFIVHDAGSACICPVRKKQEHPADGQTAPEKPAADQTPPAAPAPEQEPEPAPKPKPEKPAETVPPAAFKNLVFFVYMKAPGDKNFSLADIHKGTNRLTAIYAPRYTEDRRQELEQALDCLAAGNPGFTFQIRRIDNKKTVFTSNPDRAVFTPDRFAELFAA